MSDVTRTAEMMVPDWAWGTMSSGLRKLRSLHREAGGTSRMVRTGSTVTLTVTGSPKSVAVTMEFIEQARAALTATAARATSRNIAERMQEILAGR